VIRRCVAIALLFPAVAMAHPIEPLVTGSPMPVDQDWIAADSTYSALHDSGTEQAIALALSAGIGWFAELTVAVTIDATEATVGPVVAGGKFMLAMEGRRGIDLSVAALFSSAGAVSGTLLVGRTLIPGFYLQAAVGVDGASAPSLAASVTHLALGPVPRHGGDLPIGNDIVVFHGAAALQWAPRPRWIPTLEGRVARTWDPLGNHTDAEIVPELIYLIDINHLSIKSGVPIGLTGELSYGFIGSLDWQY
jgi:hypothetical protein